MVNLITKAIPICKHVSLLLRTVLIDIGKTMLQTIKNAVAILSMYIELSRPTALNFLWYLVVIVLMGQLGPLLVAMTSYWSGESFLQAVGSSAKNGELILCSTAILASGVYFLAKEYNSSSKIIWRSFKSVILLWSFILGLTSIFICYLLLNQHEFENDLQEQIHWWAYCLSLITAAALWLMEELNPKAKTATQSYKTNANAMTASSSSKSNIDGISI